MTRLIRVELLKIRTTRLSYGLLATGAGLTALFSVLETVRSGSGPGFEPLYTATGLNTGLNGGSYWLNLQNAKVPSGDPVYWDENSGVSCGGDDGKGGGCPSLASESAVGTIPSESFTINGSAVETTPEPASFVLLASGALGLGAVLRRKLL